MDPHPNKLEPMMRRATTSSFRAEQADAFFFPLLLLQSGRPAQGGRLPHRTLFVR
jgi:hypothetical protein